MSDSSDFVDDLRGLAARESAAPQPAPIDGVGDCWADVIAKWQKYNKDPVQARVIDWMRGRAEFGRRKYGMPLQRQNGRDPCLDLLQEILDARVYAEQALEAQSSPVLRHLFCEIVRNLDGMLYALGETLPRDNGHADL